MPPCLTTGRRAYLPPDYAMGPCSSVSHFLTHDNVIVVGATTISYRPHTGLVTSHPFTPSPSKSFPFGVKSSLWWGLAGGQSPSIFVFQKKKSYLILEEYFHTVKNFRSELNTQATSFCFCTFCDVSYHGAVTPYQEIWIITRVSMTLFTPFVCYRFTRCAEVWTRLCLFRQGLLRALTRAGWSSRSLRTFSPHVHSDTDFLHSPLPLLLDLQLNTD